jgi:hypothetical protein
MSRLCEQAQTRKGLGHCLDVRGAQVDPKVASWSGTRARATSRLSLFGRMESVQVLVRENNIDQALRVLKKKMQREGVFRENETPTVLRKTI